MPQSKKKKENQSKTQKRSTKRKQNDDESEENPTKKKTKISSNLVRKPEKSLDQMYRSLQIRTSPKNFISVIDSLKPNQIRWVKDIGFGSMLDMKIDSIPSKVAFYVVENLDINRMAIKTSKGYIQINEDSVTEIFGLRNEGEDIYEIEDGEDAGEIKKQWIKQFDNAKSIRQRHIVNIITKSNSVDMNFKLNFIVLFMNSMINTTKMGICSTNFVSSVGSNFDFKKINWCKYIYDNALSSKFTWESSSTVDFYTGPITFLTLLYLNSTKCLEVPHRRIRPAIHEWTSEKMRQREKFEIENSGFGKLDMNRDDVHDELISERQKTGEELLANLNEDMDLLLTIKAEIEFKMTKAMTLYPKDEGLKEYKAGYEDIWRRHDDQDPDDHVGEKRKRQRISESEFVLGQTSEGVAAEEQVPESEGVVEKEQVQSSEVVKETESSELMVIVTQSSEQEDIPEDVPDFAVHEGYEVDQGYETEQVEEIVSEDDVDDVLSEGTEKAHDSDEEMVYEYLAIEE